jgi:tRNA-specific 2-thiouridylase
MSGGVDSSVVAAGLSYLGYQTIGLTLRLYSGTAERPGACCAGRDIKDAAHVAAVRGFPHHVLDYEEQFKKAVIEPFAASYARGETPIPCVLCNQTVKFHDLLHTTQQLGCTALATGHYIRRTPGLSSEENVPAMMKAVDPTRDQSYFLYATTREELGFLRFPLGGLLKTETRRLAAFFDLPAAQKAESQDICFVGDKHYADIVAPLQQEALTPGPLLNRQGHRLGTHRGIAHYTIGQRRRLGLPSDTPLYVTAIDAPTHSVVVGPKEDLLCSALRLTDVNLLLPPEKLLNRSLQVRLRSTGASVDARLIFVPATRQAIVHLHTPQEAISPGQACVLYDGERTLGGGLISETNPLIC